MKAEQEQLFNFTKAVLLFDIYGSLLSEKAQQNLRLYLFEDWSLAEIAERQAISRQAVHSSLQRSFAKLESYEENLQILADNSSLSQYLAKLKILLAQEDIRAAQELITDLEDKLGLEK